ncbi:uncharacterized protein METZ01_LOCUS343285, partial [marine metagenome]
DLSCHILILYSDCDTVYRNKFTGFYGSIKIKQLSQ